MKEFFESFRFKIILCILALLIGMMLYAVTQGGKIIFPSKVLSTITSPVTKASNAISDKVSKNINMLINSKKNYDENKKLKRELAEVYKEIIDNEDNKKEISELRKFLGIKEDNEQYSLSRPCNITGRITNDPFKSFTIDQGTKQGISLYDPVVTAEGLVGVIISVADNYSTVRTLLSAQPLSVSAVCVETGDLGYVEGSVTTAKDGLTKLVLTTDTTEMKPGDIIKTSGDSGLFPNNYPIGTVQSVGIEPSGLLASAVIQPIVDPNEVTSVMVILDLGEGE
ncbi:MAG: rod shape-determining protein MreC [Oscillospiraceae bacterium]|jgi:rod shape-determining protein MreC|nr:rod shape-determining protein MreC [Oscillospiraceae bacterium]